MRSHKSLIKLDHNLRIDTDYINSLQPPQDWRHFNILEPPLIGKQASGLSMPGRADTNRYLINTIE